MWGVGEGVWKTLGEIIFFTSSHTSIIDGSPLPPRARRYYTEEEARRGRIDMNAPVFKIRPLARKCFDDLCVYYKLLCF